MTDEAAPGRWSPGIALPGELPPSQCPPVPVPVPVPAVAASASTSTTAGCPAQAGAVLRFPAGSVLVVAGIPGAGKSTFIHRLFGRPNAGVLILDSADIRTGLVRRLGHRMPYRLYRPLVHTVHYARIAAWTLGPRRNLVVHECGTRDWARHAVAALAALRRRPAHLVFLDTPPELALAGQRSRGRLVQSGSFRRHARQWTRLRCAARVTTADAAADAAPGAGPGQAGAGQAGAGRTPPARARVLAAWAVGRLHGAPPDLRREGWTTARCLTRDEAAGITAIYFDG